MRHLIRLIVILVIMVFTKIISLFTSSHGIKADRRFEEETGRHRMTPKVPMNDMIEGFLLLIALISFILAVICTWFHFDEEYGDAQFLYLAIFFGGVMLLMLGMLIFTYKRLSENYIAYDEDSLELHTFQESKKFSWDEITEFSVYEDSFTVKGWDRNVVIQGERKWRGAEDFIRFARQKTGV